MYIFQALLVIIVIAVNAKYTPPFVVNLDSTIRCEKYISWWSIRVELADYRGNMIHETIPQFLRNRSEVILPFPSALYGVLETNAHLGLKGIIHHTCTKDRTDFKYVKNFLNFSRDSKNEVHLKFNLTIDDMGEPEFYDII